MLVVLARAAYPGHICIMNVAHRKHHNTKKFIGERASEASETLSGVTNGNRRYIYIEKKTFKNVKKI